MEETDRGPSDDAAPAAELPGGRARPKTDKSELTRALILDTAMRMFQERGYNKTTMRAIATEAGVSVGNAYYYFASKEYLIQGFYDRMTHEHAVDAHAKMAGVTDFSKRLEIALTSWVDCAAPYHEFASQFFRTAADPDSPLSPFSNESHPARATAVAIFDEVLNGSDLAPKLDTELAELLPDLLWLHLMVVVLYWVFDRTDDTERTRNFVKRCTPLVAKIVSLSRYRVFRPLVRDAKGLIHDFILPTFISSQKAAGKSAGKSAGDASGRQAADAADAPRDGAGAPGPVAEAPVKRAAKRAAKRASRAQ
ncbi:TetR family transcriptional regulator [Streptomyces sp. NPDC006733]|uniref:TetR/AcrR family transcriptional regulator n=1 Tax=Streptomyces sp. NPDC006733 TaxID=3155460 RepID=UPI0033DD9473